MSGSKPGERRGGRAAGTPNKAKAQLEAKVIEAQLRATADLTPQQIAGMSPLDVMLHAMQIEAQAGAWRQAAALAERAAPYLHAKLSQSKLDVNLLDGLSPDQQRALAEALASLSGDEEESATGAGPTHH